MGYDSTIYIATVFGQEPDADGFHGAYPDVTIHMPRLNGWEWSRVAREHLRDTRDSRQYRLYNGQDEGVTHDAYGQPIIPLDRKRLIRYLEREFPQLLDTVPIAALTAATHASKKRKRNQQTVVLFYGH